jgi:hypothetical protein
MKKVISLQKFDEFNRKICLASIGGSCILNLGITNEYAFHKIDDLEYHLEFFDKNHSKLILTNNEEVEKQYLSLENSSFPEPLIECNNSPKIKLSNKVIIFLILFWFT